MVKLYYRVKFMYLLGMNSSEFIEFMKNDMNLN